VNLISLSLVSALLGVAGLQAPKDPARQLDFWIGKWKCEGDSYSPDGKATKTTARNEITLEMNDHVIHEHFSMDGLNGGSLSVYNPNKKIWQQTWVDDSGGYLALSGGFADGKMTLAMEPDAKGNIRRMVFSNIAKDSFDWDWMLSKDKGATWNVMWHLHYTREAE
jgi:hypothetical protein